MKKILFALVAIAMVLVSCKKGKEAKDLSISMEIASQPTAAGVSIKCTPSDTSIYYSLVCIPTDSLSKFDIEAASNEVYEACDSFGFEKVAAKGVYTYVYNGELEPETKYTPVAFQVDNKKRIYKTLFYGPEFATTKLPVSGMKIAITYSGDSKVTFTPDINDTYIAVLVDSTFLYSWGLENVGYCDELAEVVLYTYAYDPDHECTFTGTTQVTIANGVGVGESVFALAAPVCESHVNGLSVSKILTVGTASDAAPRFNQPKNTHRSAIRIAHK